MCFRNESTRSTSGPRCVTVQKDDPDTIKKNNDSTKTKVNQRKTLKQQL